MAYKLTYTHPAFPKEQEFELGGMLLQNGKATTLSEDDERELVSRVGMSVKDYFKGNEMVKVEGTSEIKASEVIAETGGEG